MDNESKIWAGLDILLALLLLYMAYTEITGNYPFAKRETVVEAQHVPIEREEPKEEENNGQRDES